MDLFESLDHAFETLFEDVESRMHHLLQILLGKKSRWPLKDAPDAQEKAMAYLRDASQYDPTPGKNYMMFIANQIAAGAIRLPEDGVMLKETLEKFMTYSRKAAWTHPKDVMQYQKPGTSWRDLQKLVGDYENSPAFLFRVGSQAKSTENILATKAKEGADVILSMDIKAYSGLPNYKIYKVSTPIAVSMYGKGTQWCTSWMNDGNIYKTIKPESIKDTVLELTRRRESVEGNPWANLTAEQAQQIIMDLNDGNLTKKEIKVPNVERLDSSLRTAQSYLRGGPMFIIYKNDAPYIQFTHDASQIMNVADERLATISPALEVIFKEMMGQPQAPEVANAVTLNFKKEGQLSEALVKRLTEEMKRSATVRAQRAAKAAQQQKSNPPMAGPGGGPPQ
jgi:hypothetical protein